FIINFFWNAIAAALGKKNVGDNPWQATTLDWAATTSPPLAHGNFGVQPVVYREPYEYSHPDYAAADFLPQNVEFPIPPEEPAGGLLPTTAVAQREIGWTHTATPRRTTSRFRTRSIRVPTPVCTTPSWASGS